jgi:hypothetical protein
VGDLSNFARSSGGAVPAADSGREVEAGPENPSLLALTHTPLPAYLQPVSPSFRKAWRWSGSAAGCLYET